MKTSVLLLAGLVGSGSLPCVAQSARSKIIWNQQLWVQPASYTYFAFDVDTNREPNPTLTGRFEARGGGGNDIEVVVAFRDEFLNWANGHGGSVLYTSGKKTTGTVSVELPGSGQYVVGFNNRFSLVSRKSVAGTFELVRGESATPAAAQILSKGTTGSWLDIDLENWNQAGASVPRPPKSNSESPATCPELLRTPTTSEEKEIARAGWFPLSLLRINSEMTVATGYLGVDGMCRPDEYQAFVFVRGVFAGTLSPEVMRARGEGSLGKILFDDSRDILIGEFSRYKPSDSMCCASGVLQVEYLVQRDHEILVVVRALKEDRPRLRR